MYVLDLLYGEHLGGIYIEVKATKDGDEDAKWCGHLLPLLLLHALGLMDALRWVGCGTHLSVLRITSRKGFPGRTPWRYRIVAWPGQTPREHHPGEKRRGKVHSLPMG